MFWRWRIIVLTDNSPLEQWPFLSTCPTLYYLIFASVHFLSIHQHWLYQTNICDSPARSISSSHSDNIKTFSWGCFMWNIKVKETSLLSSLLNMQSATRVASLSPPSASVRHVFQMVPPKQVFALHKALHFILKEGLIVRNSPPPNAQHAHCFFYRQVHMFACQSRWQVIQIVLYTNHIWERNKNSHQHFLHYRGGEQLNAVKKGQTWIGGGGRGGQTSVVQYDTA